MRLSTAGGAPFRIPWTQKGKAAASPFCPFHFRAGLALMPRMASANSASSFSRRARSHAVTMPTRRPFSATGRRRSCSRAMSAAALCTLSPGRAVTTARDMTSETRDAMECMCMRLVVERSDTASLEALAPVLESIRTARDSDEAAENVFLFHHELAVLSGNVLMPLLYHSFRPQSVYLWTIDCKRSGIQKMYESKLALYTALLNGDAPTAVRLTHERIARAIEALPLFGA